MKKLLLLMFAVMIFAQGCSKETQGDVKRGQLREAVEDAKVDVQNAAH